MSLDEVGMRSDTEDLVIVLNGKPKPYVRMTQRGKWVKPEAQAYLASKADFAEQMREKMRRRGRGPFPRRVPLHVDIAFYYANGADHKRDLDNEVKAILDAGNGVVWADDCWIDGINTWRGKSDSGENRVVLTVVAMVREAL